MKLSLFLVLICMIAPSLPAQIPGMFTCQERITVNGTGQLKFTRGTDPAQKLVRLLPWFASKSCSDQSVLIPTAEL